MTYKKEADLIEKADIQKISRQGERIYQKIKHQYEAQHTGHFLAIDVKSKDVFLANSSVDAVEKAREKYPDRIFYVVKIGYSAVETFAKLRQAARA